MLDFDLLYAQPDPAQALCRAVLAGLPGVGGGAAVVERPQGPRVCATPDCGRPLALRTRSTLCDRCKAAARYQAEKHLCPGGCGRLISRQAAACSSCHRRAVVARKRAEAAQAVAVVAARVAVPTVTMPVQPAPCPATPDGRHQMVFFGGLPLPGQPVSYCAACQPRDAGHRTDYFGGSMR